VLAGALACRHAVVAQDGNDVVGLRIRETGVQIDLGLAGTQRQRNGRHGAASALLGRLHDSRHAPHVILIRVSRACALLPITFTARPCWRYSADKRSCIANPSTGSPVRAKRLTVLSNSASRSCSD